MSSALQKVMSVAATAAGGIVGAMAGGPVGLGIGAALGAGVDYLRAKSAAPQGSATTVVQGPQGAVLVPPVVASAMVAGAPALPPGADLQAAQYAAHLLAIAASKGWASYMVNPAKSWVQKFQTSVGLPATGMLDPQTRALLAVADPSNKIPPGSPLG